MSPDYSTEMRRIWTALSPAERERLRALDGKPVTVADHQLTEDVDGEPLGVERIEHDGTFVLPTEWREDQEDDQ